MFLVHWFVRGVIATAVVGLVVIAIAVPVLFGVALTVAAVRLAWAIVRFGFGVLFLPFSIRRTPSRRVAACTRRRGRDRVDIDINITVLPTHPVAKHVDRSRRSGAFTGAILDTARAFQ
jgi:hypothetical protein